MRVRFRRWCRATSILALLHFSSLGCSSLDQQELDEFPDQQEFGDLEQGDLNNLEGNSVSDFNAGDANFGGNFSNDGFGDSNFGSFQGDQSGNNLGFAGGEGDLQDIIEEMNQSGFDQFGGGGFNSASVDGMMANDAAGMQGDMGGMQGDMGGMQGDMGGMQGDMGGMQGDMGGMQTMATAGAPAAPGLPELGSKMSYIVQRGDTLAKIATRIYGDPNRWTELANFTGLANPRLIYPGDVVYYQLTEQSMAFAAAYESVTRSEIQVMEGDTLSTIASRVLGSSSNWKLIWRQNDNIDNPDRLTAGTTIYYVEPSRLSSAIETFKEKFAQLPTPSLMAEKELIHSDVQSERNKQVDTVQAFAGLDVDGDKFIQIEFGSAFVQLDLGTSFNKLI